MQATRRQVLVWYGAFGGLLPTSAIHARDNPAAEAEVRNYALRTMRAADLTPPWFTSSNWDNGAYKPWTDYLTGRISDSDFNSVCANISDYCLRDVWNLKKQRPEKIDWRANVPFNWNGIHALALRFFRTGDSVYLQKWLAVVEDYADWSLGQAQSADSPMKKAAPPALLSSALTWCGIFTAFAVIAKGLLPRDRKATDSPFAATKDDIGATQLDAVPAAVAAKIALAFAKGDGPDLARAYARPIYVPNQRVLGLEALTYLAAFFPTVEGVAGLSPTLQTGLSDVLTRYRLPDGGQLEQSFNYAQNVIDALDRAAKLPVVKVPVWREAAKATVIDWSRLVGALATPTGGLPQVGNVAWGRYGKDLPAQNFGVTSVAFPFSGFYAMRSAWADDAAYMFFFYRREARGHSMAGCNSVQVAAFGRQLLSAGGSADYSAKSGKNAQSKAYLDETSSYKTCTVLVDGRSQSSGSLQGLPTDATGKPDVTSAPKTAIQSRWHSSGHFDFAEGLFAQGYKGTLDDSGASLVTGVNHMRQVVFVRALMCWVVVDVMRTSDDHRYNQVWKFSAPKNGLSVPGFAKEQVTWRPSERIIRTADAAPNAANLTLQHFGVEGLRYRAYFGEGPFGYFSAGPLAAAVPATDVHVEWAGRGPQVLLTLITPHRGLQAPIKSAADASASGIAGCRLEWNEGSRLVVQAAASPRRLSVGDVSADSAELLLSLVQPSKPQVGLAISAVGSHEFSGSTKTPIVVPKAFRWTTNASGALVPAYA